VVCGEKQGGTCILHENEALLVRKGVEGFTRHRASQLPTATLCSTGQHARHLRFARRARPSVSEMGSDEKGQSPRAGPGRGRVRARAGPGPGRARAGPGRAGSGPGRVRVGAGPGRGRAGRGRAGPGGPGRAGRGRAGPGRAGRAGPGRAGRAGPGRARAGPGRAGPGRAGPGRAGRAGRAGPGGPGRGRAGPGRAGPGREPGFGLRRPDFGQISVLGRKTPFFARCPEKKPVFYPPGVLVGIPPIL
jgi:hypothetical protein